MPAVDEVVDGWIRHFGPADRALTFLGIENEFMVPVSLVRLFGASCALVCHMDAYGPDWFGDWKTSKPESRNRKGEWKEKWRFHPQSLTYGLIGKKLGWNAGRFTVRMAFKSDPPTFDHEWFSYSDAELDAWERRIREIAEQILALLPGSVNPLACMRYGREYACPFLPGCSRGNFSFVPATAIRTDPRTIGRQIDTPIDPGMLVLSATRIETFLECPEKFRRIYIEGVQLRTAEALQFGLEVHARLATHYRSIMEGTNGRDSQ